jgi:hypothetical protein
MLPDESPLEPPETPVSTTSADASTAPMPGPVPQAETGEPPSSAPPAPRRLAYLQAFRFVFENPDWFTTIVFSSVISFLPVLGQIAHLGFYYDIVEALYRQPDAPYPKFEFRRFGDYCTRGVWPYVLAMMTGLIVYIVVCYQPN